MFDFGILKYATDNQKRSSYAVVKFSSFCTVLQEFENSSSISDKQMDSALAKLGYKEQSMRSSVLNWLKNLKLVRQEGNLYHITEEGFIKETGMCSGRQLVSIWDEEKWDENARRPRYRLASNVFIFAPEIMQVVEYFTPIGGSKKGFNERYTDCLIWGQKLNQHKRDLVYDILRQLGIIAEQDLTGNEFYVKTSPSALSLFWRIEGYLRASGYRLDEPVPIDEVEIEIERVIPRSHPNWEDDPKALGLPPFPFPFEMERGKTHYRLKKETISLLLSIRMISPITFIRILRQSQSSSSKEIIRLLKDNLIMNIKEGKLEGEPRNFEDVLKEYQ